LSTRNGAHDVGLSFESEVFPPTHRDVSLV